MRLAAVVALTALLGGCSSAPPPAEPAKAVDPTTDPYYAKTVEQLAAWTKQAEDLLAAGRADDAGIIVQRAQGLEARLLAAPRPTLAAMEAASDLDDLYGRMLLANKQYGWARDFFQKNVVRWKAWKPQTEDTERRRKEAQARVGECEKKMSE